VKIYLLPLRFSDSQLLKDLTVTLSHAFQLPASLLDRALSLKEGCDPVRSQYNSTWILSQILTLVPEEDCKILGVTSLDLYVPVLTFVFGEAQLDGRAALVSSFRLRDELYGLPKNPEKLKEISALPVPLF
jgi:archaemetzincin